MPLESLSHWLNLAPNSPNSIREESLYCVSFLQLKNTKFRIIIFIIIVIIYLLKESVRSGYSYWKMTLERMRLSSLACCTVKADLYCRWGLWA